MEDVVAHRVPGPLHAHEVLVVALAASQHQPVEAAVALVLVALDEVPPQHEVLGDVVDAGPDHAHSHVVPGQAAVVGLAQLVLLPVLHVLEVHNAVVVEVLAGPDLVGHAFGVHVRQRVLVVVPAAEAEVKPSDEGHLVVDDHELLVVGPVEGHVGRVLEDVVIRVGA